MKNKPTITRTFMDKTFSKNEWDKHRLSVVKRTTIWKELEKIERANMASFHSSYVHDAVYNDMIARCILMRNDTHDLVMGARYKKMINAYRRGIVQSPFDYGIDKFNPLLYLIHFGGLADC